MDLTNLNKDRAKSRRKSSINLDTTVYGFVPPQAKELEQAVLGGILMEKSAFDIVAEILKSECFYVDAHQRIFSAMQMVQQKSQPIDLLTIAEQLKSTGDLDNVGGVYALSVLTNSVVSSANIETHCRIILQKFMGRELIRIGGIAVTEGYSEEQDIFDSINTVEKEMASLTTGVIAKSYTHVSSVMVERLQRIAQLRKNDTHLTGITSGYLTVDMITHGWQPTDLIILAARPSVGKTAFALNLARHAAAKKIPVGFFSLEMSTGQLVDRMISAEGEIPLDHIVTGKMANDEYARLEDAAGRISEMPVFIDDTAAVNVFQLRSKLRRMKRKHGIKIAFIDYIQLMSGMQEQKTNNREQEISTISRNLKLLAKELEIALIALSQLSRRVEDRKGEKVPQLSDLRESGAIEQDADMVMFLYRAEDQNEMGESTKGLTHLKIAKHRNGTLETVHFNAQLWCQKFVTYENVSIPEAAGMGKGSWKPVPGNMFKNENDLDL